MQRITAESPSAQRALALVTKLQQQLVNRMEMISDKLGNQQSFEPVEWFRADGKFGGGVRCVATDDSIFNRGSVNVSQVQYEADESKPLASATALSSIIHPKNPLAPSVHLHVSWTELKSGHAYWRVMADLNPAIENPEATKQFRQTLIDTAPEQYDSAFEQGERYFFIPALNRHRGVCHFYLENYKTDDAEADSQLAERVISRIIDCYADILAQAITDNPSPTEADFQQQRAYHTLYLFQVLTLDRGTTSGLLVHDENDVGIMGSLPSHIDTALLDSWQWKVPEPQDQLVSRLVSCVEEGSQEGLVDTEAKQRLAIAAREHYRKYPAALDLQASGNTIPTTVSNHT
ncbi:coproporphyrinogen III oxidase [Leucothrix sargassi]|nr:coproporphyrinogen III oxidase [Leucothrix sargassi]